MCNFLFVIWLITIILTSCAPNTAISPVVTDSASPTKTLSTSTHVSTPSPSATIAPIKSETPSLTATPWPFKSIASPNREFVAHVYFEYQLPSRLPTIEIRDKKGELLWQIPFQGEMPTSDPHRSLDIFQWSNDSSQLYFYYVLSPDGGDQAFWWTGLDLQKIDIKTGEVQAVIPGKGFVSFAFSPDGTQIAYTRQQDQPSVFYVRDLPTGSEKTAYVVGSKNYVRVGDIHWSPTGKEIAFQTETDDYIVQTILLNPVAMKQKVIREYQLYTLFFDGWIEEGRLQFSEISANGARIDKVFQIDITTSETVNIGTPTPRP